MNVTSEPRVDLTEDLRMYGRLVDRQSLEVVLSETVTCGRVDMVGG